MKKFKLAEIRDLLDKVSMEQISFSRFVEIINEKVVAAKPGVKLGQEPVFQGFYSGYIKGYEDCNAEWQEKVRWKNAYKEPPKYFKKWIQFKNGNDFYFSEFIEDRKHFRFYFAYHKELYWREIIE